MRWTKFHLRTLADHDNAIWRRGIGVKIFDDGTLLRVDVPHDLATPMKAGEVVKLLGLKEHELGHLAPGKIKN